MPSKKAKTPKMGFSAQLQRSIQHLDSLDTQRVAWRTILDHVDAMNPKTASLFVKGLRRHCPVLQRPSARAFGCQAFAYAVKTQPRFCARRLVLQTIVEGLVVMCSDSESSVRAACAAAVAQTVHSVFPLVGATVTNQLNQTQNLAATAASTGGGDSDARHVNTPDGFTALLMKQLTRLLQAPTLTGRQGAALCLTAILDPTTVSPKSLPPSRAMGVLLDEGSANTGIVVTQQSRSLLEAQIPFLQKKLNQALWTERSVVGASVCQSWDAVLTKYPVQCTTWAVRGRLLDCLLRVLNTPTNETHWQFRQAAMKVCGNPFGCACTTTFSMGKWDATPARC